MLPVATRFTVINQALTGSLAELLIPATAGTVASVVLTGTADFTVSERSDGAEFPVAAGTILELPVQTEGQRIYVKGSGTLSAVLLGY